jgi:hypothetical protein
MIYFRPLETKRLSVQLRELTIQQAVELAAIPVHKHEAAVSALLGHIVKSAAGEHREPGRWTVQERMLVVAHYIACTTEGAGNFAIGQSGQFLDYLDEAVDAAPASAEAGEACGDLWRVRQVSGDEARVMEGLCSSRFDWVAADMAARMEEPGGEAETRPDATVNPGQFAQWLHDRVTLFKAMPETDFEAMFTAYRRGLVELHHLFWVELADEGYVALPRKGGGASAAPARFQASSALGALALELGARAADPGDVPGHSRGDAVPDGTGAADELRQGLHGV